MAYLPKSDKTKIHGDFQNWFIKWMEKIRNEVIYTMITGARTL